MTTSSMPHRSHSGTRTILALLARDLRVIRRDFPSFLLRTAMQPLLFVFVFAVVLPTTTKGSGGSGGLLADGFGGVNFTTLLVPGMVAIAVMFSALQSVAFPLVQEFSFTKEIEDRVLSPVPVWAIGAQKVISGALQGLVAAVVVFPIVLFVHRARGAPYIEVTHWPLFLFVLLFGALLGASLGLLLGTVIPPRQIGLLFSVVLLPITFLGCIQYPWASLSSIRWLQILVLLNPLVYISEGLRATLTSRVDHMPAWAFCTALVVGVVGIGIASMWTFRRRVLT